MARIVAELGRPETPEETASRKAESSRVYRSSQTARNLVAALLATLIIVAVVVFIVPRGQVPQPAPIDVSGTAQALAQAEGRVVMDPDLPEDWRVNRAAVESDSVRAWTITYVPSDGDGFVAVAQGFDADPAWPTRELGGADATSTVTVGGVIWDVYEITNERRAGNIERAMSVSAGADTFLITGKSPAEDLERVAASISETVLDVGAAKS